MTQASQTAQQHYDIVLVTDYFRSANAFLSILAGLGAECKIGLYLTPLAEDLRRKNNVAQAQFIEMARALGAHVMQPGGAVASTDVMLVLQRAYTEADVRAVR